MPFDIQSEWSDSSLRAFLSIFLAGSRMDGVWWESFL
jgi:hypothetical protein